MNIKITLTSFLIALCIIFQACGSDSIASLSDEALLSEMVKLNDSFDKAFKDGDKAALEKMLADEYTASANGKQYSTKQQSLEVASKPSNRNTPKVENPKIIRRDENSAVLEYEQTVTLGGMIAPARSKVKLTAVKRGGRWQIVSNEVQDLK